MVQLSRKAPLINSISMQTHRRCSLLPIHAKGTNTCTYTCAHRPNNVSSIEKRRETLYLPTSFDPSPSLSLFSLILSHILPLPGSSDECVSVSDPCSRATHTHLSADVTVHCSLSLTLCVRVCVVLCARVCACLTVHACMWVSETAE